MNAPHQLFFNAIEKINVQTAQSSLWHKEGYYVGEPVFIKNPADTREDSGVLVLIAWNSVTENSALVLLEATTLGQLAEISLPISLPPGLHGQFFARKV